jgi:hypothetical protein
MAKSDDKILSDLAKAFFEPQTFQDFRSRYARRRAAEFSRKARKIVEKAGFDPIIILSKTARATCRIIFTRKSGEASRKI